jgi:preprotein translocase subunit SecE
VGDVIAELRKVTWPTFSETRYLTVVVAFVAILLGIFLGAVDLVFGWTIDRLFF